MLKQGGLAETDGRLTFLCCRSRKRRWLARRLSTGCDYVLHVASPFPPSVPKHEDELIIPAREGALRVLRAARDAGVKRVVLTSSFAAIGYGHPPQAAPFTGDGLDQPRRQRRGSPTRNRRRWPNALPGISSPAKAAPSSSPSSTRWPCFGPLLGPDYSASILIVQRMMDGAMPGCPASLLRRGRRARRRRACICAR